LKLEENFRELKIKLKQCIIIHSSAVNCVHCSDIFYERNVIYFLSFFILEIKNNFLYLAIDYVGKRALLDRLILNLGLSSITMK